MINYKELRSGNLFATNFDKEIYQLDYISPGTTMLFWIVEEDLFIKDVNAEPIPLTEEWLIKFGFEKHGDNMFGNVLFRIEKTNNIFLLWRYEGPQVSLSSVHELQNLYFALLKEELKIKP